MIKNIILDIGNVLAEFRWKEYMSDLGFNEQIMKIIASATVANPIWNEFDRGEKSDDEIIKTCISYAPDYHKELNVFFENIEDIVHEYDYATPLIQKLKANQYNVYLLSNYPKTAFSYAKKNFSFFSYVDGQVISYEMKQIKPEPEIYKTLLDKYHLRANECVFLDDKLENINAANALGFSTIHFTSFEKAKKELKELGVVL